MYDLISDSENTVAKVKSTFEEVGAAYLAPGRFRVWNNQHEKLLKLDRDGTAWYVFVLYAANGRDVLARLN